MVQVTWPRWPPRPYMVKTFKNLLLQNRKSYDLETWFAASGTQALQSLYKWWSWVDLDLFYGKVKFGRLYVWMGKSVTKSFNGENLQQRTKLTDLLYLWKKNYPRGFSAPAPGLYTCIWPLFSNILSKTAWPITAKDTRKMSWSSKNHF